MTLTCCAKNSRFLLSTGKVDVILQHSNVLLLMCVRVCVCVCVCVITHLEPDILECEDDHIQQRYNVFKLVILKPPAPLL